MLGKRYLSDTQLYMNVKCFSLWLNTACIRRMRSSIVSMIHSRNVHACDKTCVLRTFARKFSNIDFFLKILPLKDDELVMSEM